MDSPELSSMHAYEPPESLWRLVEESVSSEERGEIRKMLGDSLVDQSLELHSEASALLEIWQSVRSETDNCYAATSPKALPEPPGMRDSLRNHIKMLVDNIREKAAMSGRNTDAVLSQHKQDIIDYAVDGSSRGSSPCGMRSRPSSSFSSRSGRETPMRMTPSSEGDGLSSSTTASEKVDSVRDRLNIFKIDEVVQELRSTLKDEVVQLLTDIRFLQNCLEEENDFRCESQMTSYSEPTLQELKEERSKLERTSSSITGSVDVISTVPDVRRKSLPGSPKHILKPLSPISSSTQRMRPSPPSSASRNPASRSSPLKAKLSYGSAKNADTLKLSRGSTCHPANGKTCINNNILAKDNANADLTARVVNPPSSSMRPSPPSSAKKGSPTSNRFRQRFRETQRQDSV